MITTATSATTLPTTAEDWPYRRIAATSALVFAALLVVQNLVRSAEPSLGADPSAVSAYFADHRSAVLIPLVLFPVGMVALLGFAAGMRALARERRDRFWCDLGTLAVVVIAALFAVVNVVGIALVAGGDDVAADGPLVAALWAIHAGAFGLNLCAIAIALLGWSRFARSRALVPHWFGVVAVPGAACLFAAALSAVPIAAGSPIVYLGFAGFVVWGVFLVACAVGLLRGSHPVR
jgi:hypothetical protein